MKSRVGLAAVASLAARHSPAGSRVPSGLPSRGEGKKERHRHLRFRRCWTPSALLVGMVVAALAATSPQAFAASDFMTTDKVSYLTTDTVHVTGNTGCVYAYNLNSPGDWVWGSCYANPPAFSASLLGAGLFELIEVFYSGGCHDVPVGSNQHISLSQCRARSEAYYGPNHSWVEFAVAGAIRRVPYEYATIQAAINAAASGDVVEVAEGYYLESITLKSGVWVKGAGANRTFVSSQTRTVTGADGATISGFTITSVSGDAAIYCFDSSPVIRDNVITGSVRGIFVEVYGNGAFASPIIENNVIVGNSDLGIGVWGHQTYVGPPASAFPSIRNNVVAHNQTGIWLGSTNGGVIVEPSVANNTIANNATDGIHLPPVAGILAPVIVNNIVVQNGGCGLRTDDAAALSTVAFNNVWGNSGGAYCGLPAGIRDIAGDPLFIASGSDYRLRYGSPSIDAGNPSEWYDDARIPPSRGTEVNDQGAYGGPQTNATASPGSLGSTCSAPSECATGFCVDGVCCGAASCPQGFLCNLDGFEGSCQLAPLACDNDGIVEPGEQCDEGGANGTPSSCCTANCRYQASGEVCRPDAGVCDLPETCSGDGAECPSDVLLAGVECRPSTNPLCDPIETCSGDAPSCPGDVTSCAECNHNGVKDGAEDCDGSDTGGATCPNLCGAPSCNVDCTLNLSGCLPADFTCTGDVDCGNVAVLCLSPTDLLDTNRNGVPELDQNWKLANPNNAPQRITRRFYASHSDTFQFLTFFSAFAQEGSNTPITIPVQNHVEGLGFLVNFSPRWGGSGRLESFINMKQLSDLPQNPSDNDPRAGDARATTLEELGHELLHRWGVAKIRFRFQGEGADVAHDELVDVSKGHWSFYLSQDPSSVLYGNHWTYLRSVWGQQVFGVADVTRGYSPLDLYLMGLNSSSEVPDVFYIDPLAGSGSCGLLPVFNGRSQFPCTNGLAVGSAVNVSIQDIIRAMGPRVPTAQSSQIFRQAFVLLIQNGQQVRRDDILKVDRIRTQFETWFELSTNSRGTIDSRLRGD